MHARTHAIIKAWPRLVPFLCMQALVRPSAGGFVNGVLRAAARRLEDGALPDPQVREAPAAVCFFF